MTAARNRNINIRAQHAKGAIFIDTPRGSSPSVNAHLAMSASAATKQSSNAEARASGEGVCPTRLGPHHVEPTGQRTATASTWQRAMALRHVGTHIQNNTFNSIQQHASYRSSLAAAACPINGRPQPFVAAHMQLLLKHIAFQTS